MYYGGVVPWCAASTLLALLSGSCSSGSSSASTTEGGRVKGSILISQCVGSPYCPGSGGFTILALFGDALTPYLGAIVPCIASYASGACTVYLCAGYPDPPSGVSAGALTVSGPLLNPAVTVMPGSAFYVYGSSTPGFAAGQMLSLSAAGATFPAFGPHSIVAPGPVQLTQPQTPQPHGGPVTISTASDLQVAWSGGESGATMTIEELMDGSGYYTHCTWNASDGQGIVPASTLQHASNTSGYLVYGQSSETSFAAGSHQVGIQAQLFAGYLVNFQ